MTKEEFEKAPLLDQILYGTSGMFEKKYQHIEEFLDKHRQDNLKLLNKTETMTAREYLLDLGFDDAHLPELFNNEDKSYYQINELMEEYHQEKLKLLTKKLKQ